MNGEKNQSACKLKVFIDDNWAGQHKKRTDKINDEMQFSIYQNFIDKKINNKNTKSNEFIFRAEAIRVTFELCVKKWILFTFSLDVDIFLSNKFIRVGGQCTIPTSERCKQHKVSSKNERKMFFPKKEDFLNINFIYLKNKCVSHRMSLPRIEITIEVKR